MASSSARSLFFLSLAVSILASPSPYYYPGHKRNCGSSYPNDDLRAQHGFLQDQESLGNGWWNATTMADRVADLNFIDARGTKITDLSDPYTIRRRQATTTPLYTIDTYFHVVADTANSVSGSVAYVTDKMLTDQLAYMSNAYEPFGIAFNLISTSRTVNDTWAKNGDDLAMKQSLRQGTYSTLNVYFQTLLQSYGENNITAGSVLIGKCSLPSAGVTSTTDPSVYVLDGCNVLSGTLPGSYATDYNIGGTTVHEVGHWNGLLHPFQDDTCDPTNFGDYVADTPQESEATTGCPIGKDTCTTGADPGIYSGDPDTADPYTPSGYAGVDPIHNFMDYSQDSCYEGFTAGQGARMVNLWVLYRMGL